ncbi:hypothetical protein FOA43_002833 [Brettanomyces nanus]|uniref:Protein kinase domain-containing protein n=1 Tax=Eeniella nana TaxID=13502 RepID=A0A875S3F3_EENNA|nr:uncharacterized protein FOA43_002833 [Brettanomyces nanus]QPG75478.1 hypothetical protein FOA43_002833 [Brettanomyces nanus]
MSVVKYNSDSSLINISDGLSVVHKNAQSNSLVVYNSNTNSFQLISLEGYQEKGDSGSSSNFSKERSDKDSFSFICANCGYENHLGDTGPRKRRHASLIRGKEENKSGEDPGDSNLNDSGANKRRRNSNSLITNGDTGLGGRYITTSSGDLLREDYFRLLAKIDATTNKSSMDLIKRVKKSGINKGSSSDRDYLPSEIPFELINQGYFQKFFRILKELGNGSNGKVYKVEHELMDLNLGVFALKKIAIGDDVQNLVRILNEVKFLYNLSEKAYNVPVELGSASILGANNIVRYNHVWLEIDQVSKFGPKVPVVFILYEYCDGGDLDKFVKSLANPGFDLEKEKLFRKLRRLSEHDSKLPDDVAKFRQVDARYLNNYEIYKIFNDAVNGVNYLHELKIIHRDLKPSNCLFKNRFPADYRPITSIDQLDRIPMLLVSDFGESIMENGQRSSTGTTGTLEFCAPELFQLVKSQDSKNSGRFKEFSHFSDVYSLGMILYFLCFNRLPFKSDLPDDIREEITQFKMFDGMEDIRPLTKDASDQSKLLRDYVVLIRKMINPEMQKRPTASEVVEEMGKVYKKLDNGKHLVESDKLEVVALVNDQSVISIDGNFNILAVTGLTIINIWMLAKWSYLVNIEYLTLGLVIAPRLRPYLMVLQMELFMIGLGITYSVHYTKT